MWISRKEYERRQHAIRDYANEKGLKALILFSPVRIFYFTGYPHIPTQRPVALVIPAGGEPFFFLPKLEEDHAELRVPWVRRKVVYFEYPDKVQPLHYLVKTLKDEGVSRGPVGADSLGPPKALGYRGPSLKDVDPSLSVILVSDVIDDMRMVKSREEVGLLRESSRWASLAHSFLQEHVKEGVSELEVSLRASLEASRVMMRVFGEGYTFFSSYGRAFPAYAGFRGQVGAYSYYPHMLSNNRKIRKGDVLVTGAGAGVGGYSVELERTMFVGKPDDKKERLFNAIVKAQQQAIESIRPNVKCSEIHKVAIRVLKQEGVEGYVQHRTGHGIGLEYHEAPFFAEGDDTLLRPGMVMTCEPGVYVKGLGGFRHSDTVVVTEDGFEVITSYPRSIEELTIAVDLR